MAQVPKHPFHALVMGMAVRVFVVMLMVIFMIMAMAAHGVILADISCLIFWEIC